MQSKNVRNLIAANLLRGLVASVCCVLVACGGSRQNDPLVTSEATLHEVLVKAVENSILPAVNRFHELTNTFDVQAETFCLAPDANGLYALQSSWREMAEAWYRLLPYNFGPLNDDIVFPAYIYIDSYRLRGTNYTATLRNEIANNIAGTHDLDADFFAGESFQKVGLPALELLVFETSGSQSNDVDEQVNEYVEQPRKCATLLGLAEQLFLRADDVKNGWYTEFKDSDRSWLDLFLSSELEDDTEPMVLLITTVQQYLDYLRARQVATSVAELSGSAWSLLSASITEIDSLLQGQGDTRFTFIGFMAASGHESEVQTVLENLDFARASIQQNNPTDFGVAVALLDGNFKREIPNSLEVNLGISFSDGD